MNSIRKFSGVIWILLGPAAIYVLLNSVSKILAIADGKIEKAADVVAKSALESAKTNTILQWGIMIAIFIPIMIGLVIFGYYALKGEYDRDDE